MNKLYIFGALECDKIYSNPDENDFIIAADKGLESVKKLGLKPNLTIGDFDSLGYIPNEKNTIVLPKKKDDTDMGCAIKYGIEKGYDSFEIYGAIGGLFDHSLANVQHCASLAKQGKNVCFYHENHCMTAIYNSNKTLSGRGRLSVFAFGEEASGVDISGAEYELKNAVLSPFFPLGVSNSFIGSDANISVENGTLIVDYEL